jgi:hypothetical protein
MAWETDRIIALTCQVFSILVSAYTLYLLYSKGKIHYVIKRYLIGIQLWNFAVQIAYHYLYGFVIGREIGEGSRKGFSAAWILMHGLFYATTSVNILILNLFSSLNPKITKTKIYVAHALNSITFFAFQIVPIIGLIAPLSPTLIMIEKLGGILYIAICILYDNLQGMYLVTLINRFHKKNKKGCKEEAMAQLKRTVTFNAFLIAFDWISILIFLLQMFWFSGTSTAGLLQQLCACNAGLYSACVVQMFQNLRHCTFPTRNLSKTTLAPPIAVVTEKILPIFPVREISQ